jgi:hypothetical protein
VRPSDPAGQRIGARRDGDQMGVVGHQAVALDGVGRARSWLRIACVAPSGLAVGVGYPGFRCASPWAMIVPPLCGWLGRWSRALWLAWAVVPSVAAGLGGGPEHCGWLGWWSRALRLAWAVVPSFAAPI